MESGSKYLIVAEGGALTLLDGKSYGYPENTDVTVENDQIVLTNETLAFTFTTKGTGYTIKSVGSDAYLYMTGTYNSLNWKSSEQESGDVWTVETQSDGTFKILNVDKEKWLQFDTKYSSYGAYNTQKGALPVLYKLTKVE